MAFEPLKQEAPEAPAPPFIRHRDGEVGRGLIVDNVARIADDPLAGVREGLRNERQVIVVVDLREAGEQLRRQLLQGAEEALVPRLVRERAHEGLLERRVLRQDRADGDALAAEVDHVDESSWIMVNGVGHDGNSSAVMAGLVPAIHASRHQAKEAWMPATSAGMTQETSKLSGHAGATASATSRRCICGH